jgi:RNA polymerase sigma factor (sigma-70 family)
MSPALTYSDPELLSLCGRGGDAVVWDEFVARFNRRIVSFIIRERRARGIVQGANEAEVVGDLTQEVYVRLLAHDRRALRNFHGDSDLAVVAYLARVVRAVVGDHLRRERSQKRSVRLVSITESPDGDGASVGDTLEADAGAAPDRLMSERLMAERLRTLGALGARDRGDALAQNVARGGRDGAAPHARPAAGDDRRSLGPVGLRGQNTSSS